MKPFYFGDSSRPLLGIYHPPRAARRRWGVVICNPFGQEYLRAHRALRELASRLADSGFHVLRFDYSACGDSAGEGDEGRFSIWLEDCQAAVEEVREISGARQIALVGLRLGGAVALEVARKHADAEGLVLWDPVLDGTAYLAELRAAHAAWIRDHAGGRPHEAVPETEALGFPLTAGLQLELKRLDLGSLPAWPARRALVVSSSEEQHEPRLPPGVELQRFPPSPVWLHAEGMERALVPGALLDHVASWMGDACR